VRSNLAQDAVPALAVDLVVVDEASMIDLDMMARLLAAVPLGASLILLGDKDQLASVEAGAVMGQLCAGAELGRYDADTRAWLAHTTGADVSAWAGDGSALAQQTVMLRQSHRFADDSGIGQWARAVNAGDSALVAQLWRQAPDWDRDAPASVTRLQPGQAHDPRLKALVRQGWQTWLQQLSPLKNGACSDAQALAALKAFANFQVLCAVRDGPWGVDSLNQRIAASLGLPDAGWYAGRPVMVTRNDYNLKLMNGDVGLCLNHHRGLRVAFPDGQGGMRWVLPARLDAVETVFAMTVHKSQGSEFDHVALVLPDRPVAVLTRELLYTGMTRAKTRLTLVVPQAQVLWHAVATQVLRSGGLTDL
jgi:exodeoxyribonuclease V alpha subunit